MYNMQYSLLVECPTKYNSPRDQVCLLRTRNKTQLNVCTTGTGAVGPQKVRLQIARRTRDLGYSSSTSCLPSTRHR